MEKAKIPNVLLAVVSLVCLLALGVPGPAQAAPEHQVTIKLEFTDAPSCADKVMVFTASSCDGDDISDGLDALMKAEGLTSFCAYSPLNDDWECAFWEPSGCDLVDMDVSILVGMTCPDRKGSIQWDGPIGDAWVYIFSFE